MSSLVGRRCENEAFVGMTSDTRVEDQGEFERHLINLSSTLAATRWPTLGGAVDRALHDVLDHYALDQAWLFQVLPEDAQMLLRYAASREFLPFPQRSSYREQFPSAFRTAVLGDTVVSGPPLDDLAVDAAIDRASMRALMLAQALHIPLQVEGEVRFVLMAARTTADTPWSEQCISRLKVLGELLAGAISRADALAAAYTNRHDDDDISNSALSGQWEWDVDADRLYFSDTAKHILGMNVQRMSQLLALVHATDRSRVERSFELARSHPGKRMKLRYAVHTPAGETRFVQQCHELVSPGDGAGRLVATVRDARAAQKRDHEMVLLREQQWHSVRVAQASLLVASLAHELSQPLSAILNNAQAGLRFLRNDALDREDIEDILTDIVASNKRASEVLGALRAMLKRQDTTRITFDASDAVKDVLALVRSELMTELIDVETSLAAGCYLTADKMQIEQVLLNLVMNAIDAMRGVRSSRRLRLTLSTDDTQGVQLMVMDSGCGIPVVELPKVFEAFWTTKKKGLGIGLPVCRAIVESYGGRIWCENNEEGGVTFRLTLPSAEQQQ